MNTEKINCPLCSSLDSSEWARENGYTAVKCTNCGLIYVNPRPQPDLIEMGVETGEHREVKGLHHSKSRRVSAKILYYKKLFKKIYPDIWGRKEAIRWLDVGAGYGEVVQAVKEIAPLESRVDGIEPMSHKVKIAREAGVSIKEGYVDNCNDQYNFVSILNVFSHIPDFNVFLNAVSRILDPDGEVIIQTGNIGDLKDVSEVPSSLNLPDHLVFAGEKNLTEFLDKAGFQAISITRRRKDGIENFLKNVAKRIIGRPEPIRVPYTSSYRSLFIRAKRKKCR